MENKKNIKTRFMAGALALMLSGAPMTVVKGEEQLVQEETQVELIDMFKTDYEITDPEYDVLYENQYVSEDEKTEKWFASYLPEIDGLKRTDKKRKIKSSAWESSDDEFKGDYKYLYFNFTTGYAVPFVSDEVDFIFKGDEYKRMKDVVEISDEAMEILHNYGLYRLSDNVFDTKYILGIILKGGKAGLAYLEPISLDEKNMTLKIHAITDKDGEYEHDIMNGMLISPSNNGVNNGYFTATEEEKTLVLKKK